MKLRIGQPKYGGAFLAHPEPPESPVVDVRFVLPNELIEGPYPEQILKPSPNRVVPRCPHFGTCGGCDYQHATYPTQVDLKQTILRHTLEATGLTNLPPTKTHTADPWEYRNRIRLRVEQTDGIYRAGYNRRASRDFLPVTECPISAPILLRAAFTLLEASATEPNIAAWLPSIAEVELQSNANAIQLTVFTRDGRTQTFTPFCEALHRHLPELTGAGCLAATAGYGAKERASWGSVGLTHLVHERNYWVSRGGFFQVNRFLVSEMVELVTKDQTGTLAWDLFAGVGLFSRALTTAFSEVVAVESSSIAAKDLATAAKASKTNTLRAIHSETADFLRRAVLQRERPDLIVTDPPRAGLGPEVCELLARVAAPRLVYISCDPTTLARDLAMLVHSGYCLTELHLLDMFPQTFHMETIVFLQK